MKLRELLSQLQGIQKKIESSPAYICGGTPRDRYLKHLENISDLDITTGDKSVQYLSNEFGTALAKKFNVTLRNHDDGHSTVYIGSFKMDFSSNFNVPGIEEMLLKKGIRHPSDMQKEMYSRDFTCNALLLSLDLKNLVDPTHQGFKDIKDRVIRTCLSPEITLTSNKNRVIRAIYLSSKLDFDIDPAIIEFVNKNPDSVKISTERVMSEKLNEAFNRDPDRAVHNITQMGLWQHIPITQVVQPYYMKATQQPTKVAYFQGGGGVNEPEPKKKKYKSDPALVVQPRFKEPLYRNYDLYDVPGEHGPGPGWHSMQNFKSVQDFLKARRKKLKDKYKADDSWQVDSGERVKKNPNKEARMALFSRIIKTAGDENGGPNFDYGDGAYTAMSEGKKLKTITDHKHKGPGSFFADDNEDHMMPPKEHGTKIYDWKNSIYQGVPKSPVKKRDSNHIDFPIDEQLKEGPTHFNEETVQGPLYLGPEGPPGDLSTWPGATNMGDEQVYPYSAEIGGDTIPYPDKEGKNVTNLDFGRDYAEDTKDHGHYDEETLDKLTEKYLSPSPTPGLFGLPDGVDLPDEDLGDPNNINPDYGTLGPESLIYEDKWNI